MATRGGAHTGEIERLLEEEGIKLAGIAPASSHPEHEARYAQWIAQGHHGSMGYLERHAPLKYHPQRILPGCRSILVVALGYYREMPQQVPRGHGRIARYAMGRDYHEVLGARLRRIAGKLQERYPGERFRSFVDSGPLAERQYAEAAGIGFVGRNTLLITAAQGSWVVLGEILSTRELSPVSPAAGEPPTTARSCPPRCRRCIDACPTGALVAPHRIDGSRCISYLTIEHRGAIPADLRPLVGERLFGCDVCQEVCPLNACARPGAEFLSGGAGGTQELERILAIRDDREFARLFAGSPLLRPKRAGLMRNACIAAANSGASELLPLLAQLADRGTAEHPLVVEHAAWAVRELERTARPQGPAGFSGRPRFRAGSGRSPPGTGGSGS